MQKAKSSCAHCICQNLQTKDGRQSYVQQAFLLTNERCLNTFQGYNQLPVKTCFTKRENYVVHGRRLGRLRACPRHQLLCLAGPSRCTVISVISMLERASVRLGVSSLHRGVGPSMAGRPMLHTPSDDVTDHHSYTQFPCQGPEPCCSSLLSRFSPFSWACL